MARENSTGDTIIKYILVTILSALIAYFIIKNVIMDNVAPFISQYDGKNYVIRKIGTEKTRQTAADYLAILTGKINTLVYYMYVHNLPNPDTAKRLFFRWSRCELKETNSYEKSAAFTLNKSTAIRICIRDNEGNFEDINTSMFVILHELAHVASVTFGHGAEFTENFHYITQIASNLGIYKPEDFHKNPKTYCGTTINQSPCSTDGWCEYNTIKLK